MVLRLLGKLSETTSHQDEQRLLQHSSSTHHHLQRTKCQRFWSPSVTFVYSSFCGHCHSLCILVLHTSFNLHFLICTGAVPSFVLLSAECVCGCRQRGVILHYQPGRQRKWQTGPVQTRPIRTTRRDKDYSKPLIVYDTDHSSEGEVEITDNYLENRSIHSAPKQNL